jgi:hypothetical protein
MKKLKKPAILTLTILFLFFSTSEVCACAYKKERYKYWAEDIISLFGYEYQFESIDAATGKVISQPQR